MRGATPQWRALALACLLLHAGRLCAQPSDPAAPPAAPGPTPGAHADELSGELFPMRAGEADCYDEMTWENGGGDWALDSLARLHEFSSRNSFTHGRATGLGKPLRGTSWLNRPYEVSFDVGAFLMTGRPADGVRGAHDRFAALTAGWDWDHYWGAQARLGWSTPDLQSSSSGSGESDNLFLTDLSLMYYPWGDSKIRPYWRMGMGLTDIEYTNINGVRQQEFLFTVPFGIGVKHQTSRWLVWKIEAVDNLAFGINETRTMNNFTLTCGFEARYGGRPSGYWAWSPRAFGW